MTITPVDDTNAPGSTGPVTSFATDVPAGVQNGDLLLWTLVTPTTGTAPTPAGWGVWATAAATSPALSQYTFYRYANSEPASYTATGLTSVRWGGAMLALRGIHPTIPNDVAFPASNLGTTALTYPAITPATPGALVVAIGTVTGPSGTVDIAWTVGNLTAVDTDAGSASAGSTNAFVSHGHFTWSSGAFTPTGPAKSVTTTRTIGTTTAVRPAPVTGTLAATAPAATAALTGAVRVAGSLAATAPSATAALTGAVRVSGTLAATAPAATAALSGTIVGTGGPVSGTLAATAPPATAALTGAVRVAATLAATAPAATAQLTGTVVGGAVDDPNPDQLTYTEPTPGDWTEPAAAAWSETGSAAWAEPANASYRED